MMSETRSRSITILVQLVASIVFFSSAASADEIRYLNTNLIEETSDFDFTTAPQLYAEDVANYREEVTVPPQNRGVLLYADDNIAVYNKALVEAPLRQPKSVKKVGLLLEGPVCTTQDISAFRNRVAIRETFPGMKLVIVINKEPDFVVTSDWFWDEVRPVIKDSVAGQFCSGSPSVVDFSIWFAGLQHTTDGEIINIAQYTYPTFSAGEAVNTSFVLNDTEGGPTKIIRPTNAGFAYGALYFWEKMSSDQKNKLQDMGYVNDRGLFFPERSPQSPSVASYKEDFNLFIGYGQSSYNENGSIKNLYEPWRALSYTEYAWHLGMKHNRRVAIQAAEEAVFEASRAFLSAIGRARWKAYCSGDDMEWYEWNSWEVTQRQETSVCKKLAAGTL